MIASGSTRYWSTIVTSDVPAVVVTVTSWNPTCSAGCVTVSEVADCVRIDALVPPNLTSVTPSKLLPMIVT